MLPKTSTFVTAFCRGGEGALDAQFRSAFLDRHGVVLEGDPESFLAGGTGECRGADGSALMGSEPFLRKGSDPRAIQSPSRAVLRTAPLSALVANSA
jgi:hypothetical protein